MNYYENEHGKDVRDWNMENKPFDWIKISFFNAVKYNVRAGKKPGEDIIKYLNKRDDYMEDYIKITGMKAHKAYNKLYEATKEFMQYDN